MFENLSHLALQQYWWMIISLLGAFLVFLLFVQGGQTLIYKLGKTELEKKLIINVLGHKWEFTFTTLVTFGGAFFASFPLFYATSFGGAYWLWMAILLVFIIQAVSFEFRAKPGNFMGRKTYEAFLVLNGTLGTILLGIVVSTFFSGANFIVEFGHHGIQSSRWTHPAHGLEAIFNLQNLALGFSVFFLARLLGAMYIRRNIDHQTIAKNINRIILKSAIPFLLFFLIFLTILFTKNGYAYHPDTGVVFMEDYKYLHNLLEMPINSFIFLAGVVLVLTGIFKAAFKDSTKAFLYAGTGTVLTVFSLFIMAGFNNTCFYPSTADLQSSLTIENSSTSHKTLTAMSYVSLIIPLVLLYIIFAWRAMNKKKMSKEELEGDSHTY